MKGTCNRKLALQAMASDCHGHLSDVRLTFFSCSTGTNNRTSKSCLPHTEEACGNGADTEETRYVLEVSGAGGGIRAPVY